MVEIIPEEQREYICVSLIDGSIVWHRIGNKILYDDTKNHQTKLEGKDIRIEIANAKIDMKKVIDDYKKTSIYQTRITSQELTII